MFSPSAVKYLKEVIPFFKKASILSEIGWNFSQCGPGVFSTDVMNPILNGRIETEVARSDTTIIPLLLSHLMKGCSTLGISTSTVNSSSSSLTPSPSENKHHRSMYQSTCNSMFHLRSPDGTKTCTLRAPNSIQSAAWFSAIHSAINSLTSKIVSNLSHILVHVLEGSHLKHMAWVHEKVNLIF